VGLRGPRPTGRLLTELMVATGLRLGDACALGYDPIVFDRDTNPYIRYWNHKMRREAYVPIGAATLDRVRGQQRRTRQQQLRAFVAAANITDEAGRPVAITAHQGRHTFATGHGLGTPMALIAADQRIARFQCLADGAARLRRGLSPVDVRTSTRRAREGRDGRRNTCRCGLYG
jgi:integrase